MSVRCALGVALLVAGCSTSAREIREARNSGYETDFAIVYNAAVEATKKKYPRLREDARSGVIRTAWHPVRIQSETSGSSTDNVGATATGNPLGTNAGRRTFYYVRFRVFVLGGDPWRVRIEGEASEWQTGGVPAPLKGAAIPPWLQGRVDALRVDIHDRLREYAVEVKSTAEKPKVARRKLEADTTPYGALPPAAAKVVATVAAAARARDLDEIRKHLVDDFTWGQGAQGAETAMAMFSADNTLLEAMSAALAAGCAARGPEIRCPADALEPGYRGYFASFQVSGGAWKMASFYRDE